MIRLLITGWILISTSTTATVYNAVPEQCGSNPTVSAFGTAQKNVGTMRIAMIFSVIKKPLKSGYTLTLLNH